MTLRRFLDSPVKQQYDVVVIGGGISGAAVAYEAASRGLSVALVEKEDFGGGTSAATSKLIHGGARYLVNKEFGLVRESLRERRILSNIAPNFVYPLPVMVPAYSRNRTLKAGMIIYDALSYDKGRTWDRSKKIPLHRTLSPEQVVELEPAVKLDGLAGAHVYYDCTSISPERLTLAFVKSAAAHGADVANYARTEGFLFADDKTVCGVTVLDQTSGAAIELRGKVTINCAGPWANLVLERSGRFAGAGRIIRSEGIHLVVRKRTNQHLISLPAAEGKTFLLIPWRGHTLVGPTDKVYPGGPDDYRVTAQSVRELIDCANTYFTGDARLTICDVLYAYGGLRPLVEGQQHDVRQMSRKYEIEDHAAQGVEGLVTVEGGKYTTSRHLAVNVMKVVAKKLGGLAKKSVTHKRFLAGCEVPDVAAFMARVKEDARDLAPSTAEWLARHYGSEYADVVAIARSDKVLAEPLNADGEILAEAVYAVRHEMARTLKDIVLRRTGLGTLGDPGGDVIERAADVAANELGWDGARRRYEIGEVRRMLEVPRE